MNDPTQRTRRPSKCLIDAQVSRSTLNENIRKKWPTLTQSDNRGPPPPQPPQNKPRHAFKIPNIPKPCCLKEANLMRLKVALGLMRGYCFAIELAFMLAYSRIVA